MHKNCSFDKDVGLSTICWRINYFISCTEFILVIGKFPMQVDIMKSFD